MSPVVLGLVALLVASSAAAQATTVPQCALGCARADAIKAGCDLSDTSCLCKTSFASNVIQCSRTTSCSQAEQAQASAIVTAMCAAISSGSPAVSRMPSSRSSQGVASSPSAAPSFPSSVRNG
ncbi:hypothetical protein B0H19DRAFT_601089 [Mycena capillaripes]|nr:hypothetical protein B0H19DRAFT_601089 [Mycena capillaripes]